MNRIQREIRNALIKSDFENGERFEDIAQKHCITAVYIGMLAKTFNWENAVARKRKPRTTGFRDFAASNISKPETRNADMITAYRSGLTLQQIGDQHNVTRERVRQIMLKGGIATTEGGGRIKSARNKDKRVKLIESRCYLKYGLTRAEWKEVGARGRQGWREHKRNAGYRGLDFTLTLYDWWAIWKESGQFEFRGRGIGKYCMSRIGDEGGYTQGNVYITTIQNNGRECRTKHKGMTVFRGGVYCLYPCGARPWAAKYSKFLIGLYAHEADARAARAEYMAINNLPKATKTKRATHGQPQQVAA